MTFVLSSGTRKNRSMLRQRAFSRPPLRLLPDPREVAVELLPETELNPPFAAVPWMSAQTRQQACDRQDEPGLPWTFRQALMSLTDLYQIPVRPSPQT